MMLIRHAAPAHAGLDMFRLGSVIGGTLVTGARSEALYQAIEELADEKSSITLLNKAQAAVSTSKVALALNSVRTAMQVCSELHTYQHTPPALQDGSSFHQQSLSTTARA
jgi:hypothetical protein